MNTEGKGIDIHNMSIGILQEWFDRDYMADLTARIERKFNTQMQLAGVDSDADGVRYDEHNAVTFQQNDKRWDQSFNLWSYGSFKEDADYINERITQGAEKYFRTLMHGSGVRETPLRSIDTNLKVQRTPPGGGFNCPHWEQGPGKYVCGRYAVWMLYLNDVEEGGYTSFPIQKKDVVPTAGTLVIWPAAYTHVHHGNPPIDCWKYVITGWYNYETDVIPDDEYEQYAVKESSD